MSKKEKDVDRIEDIGEALDEDNALSLIYIKLHRCVLEAFVAHDLNKTTQRVFLYLCFNALVHQGVSHRTPYKDIAVYFNISVRSVYRAISDLAEAGLIIIRHHGDLVCDIPALLLANEEARSRGKEARQKADDEEFLREVAKHEQVLNRNLSANERDRLRMILNKQKSERSK